MDRTSPRFPTAAAFAAIALTLAVAGAHGAGVEIVSPQHEDTVHDNLGNVEVRLRADLGPEQQVRLLIDGRPVAPDTRRDVVTLENVERGEHTLQAQVIGRQGEVVAQSKPVVFYMWQASAQFHRRTPAPQPPAPPPAPKPQSAPLRTN